MTFVRRPLLLRSQGVVLVHIGYTGGPLMSDQVAPQCCFGAARRFRSRTWNKNSRIRTGELIMRNIISSLCSFNPSPYSYCGCSSGRGPSLEIRIWAEDVSLSRRRLLLVVGCTIVSASAWAQAPKDHSRSRIAREVRHELLMMPYFRVFDHLTFRVEGDTVTLLGQVTRPC